MTFVFNRSSSEMFNSFPENLRVVMMLNMNQILADVGKVCPGAVVTSGFRCPVYNRSIGSSGSSKHQYGLALDFRSSTVDGSKLKKAFQGKYYVLIEADHVHVGFL